jgi:hypothetical protein
MFLILIINRSSPLVAPSFRTANLVGILAGDSTTSSAANYRIGIHDLQRRWFSDGAIALDLRCC